MNPFLISTVWAQVCSAFLSFHDSWVLETSKTGMRFQNLTKSKLFSLQCWKHYSVAWIWIFPHLTLTHSYHSRVKINSEAGPAPRLTLTVIVGDYNRRRAGPDAYYHVGFVWDIVCPADSDYFLQCVLDGSSRPFVLLCLWVWATCWMD